MVVINNAIAHEAKEKMGPIPSVILNKEVKFLFLLVPCWEILNPRLKKAIYPTQI